MAFCCGLGGETLAQTAAERAAELKTWRAQCADPDPDLQIGYLEAAIDTDDTSIIRICLRQALVSDQADTRNMALRAAIASVDSIVFKTEMPPQLAAAYEDAEGDNDALREISRYYITGTFDDLRNGLRFDIDDALPESSQSVWFAMANRTKRDDRNAGDAIIVGSAITWQGNIQAARGWFCVLAIELDATAHLVGDLKCDEQWAIPVSASLL